MERVLFAVISSTLALAAVTAAPASAEPRQGVSGNGTLSVTVSVSGDSVTWGPWRWTGAWQSDDNAAFVGRADADSATTAPPVPAWVVPDIYLHGANGTGSLDGTCEGA